MMSNLNRKQNRLFEDFRAAGRLVNEWRDTLGYGFLFTLAAADTCLTGQLHPDAFVIAVIAGCREAIRAVSWVCGKDTQIAGGHNLRLNRTKLGVGAMFACSSIFLIDTLCLYAANGQSADFFAYMHAVVATGSLVAAGGVREVLKAYTEIMWDYPRKRGGGGRKTQTQRLKAGLSEVARGIAGQLGGAVPRPASMAVQRNLSKEKTLTPKIA